VHKVIKNYGAVQIIALLQLLTINLNALHDLHWKAVTICRDCDFQKQTIEFY